MRFPRSCYTSLNNVLKTIHLNENEMITLNLGIGDGDIDRISFKTPAELDEYILEIELSDFDSVWLITQGGENSEIFVTEDLHIVRLLLHQDYFFGINTKRESELHIHEYNSYEDAYKVALDMREPNPKCYNK